MLVVKAMPGFLLFYIPLHHGTLPGMGGGQQQHTTSTLCRYGCSPLSTVRCRFDDVTTRRRATPPNTPNAHAAGSVPCPWWGATGLLQNAHRSCHDIETCRCQRTRCNRSSCRASPHPPPQPRPVTATLSDLARERREECFGPLRLACAPARVQNA